MGGRINSSYNFSFPWTPRASFTKPPGGSAWSRCDPSRVCRVSGGRQPQGSETTSTNMCSWQGTNNNEETTTAASDAERRSKFGTLRPTCGPHTHPKGTCLWLRTSRGGFRIVRGPQRPPEESEGASGGLLRPLALVSVGSRVPPEALGRPPGPRGYRGSGQRAQHKLVARPLHTP